MTLVEFLAPVAKAKNQDRVLATLYYRERYDQLEALTVDGLRKSLKTARIKGAQQINIADVLNKAGALVDTTGSDGKSRLWRLTDSGRIYVRKLLELPEADVEVEHDVGVLEHIVAKIVDVDVQDYLGEALKCLRVGGLRACVVFVWTATARTLQARMLTHGATAVTAAVQRHDPRYKGTVSTVDDFAYVKDNTMLLAAKDLHVLDKNEKDTLKEALDLRNRCGHPSKYRPGIKKVSAFIEDITSIVFN